MAKLRPGDRVRIEFGFDGFVQAEVEQVYGPPVRPHVLVRLTPELSGDVVDEAVTVSVPLAAVQQADAA